MSDVFVESEHPRDYHGRFRRKFGFPPVAPGKMGEYGSEATVNTRKLVDILRGLDTQRGASATKLANVERVANAMVEAARTDKALSDQLDQIARVCKKHIAAERKIHHLPKSADKNHPQMQAASLVVAMMQDTWAASASDTRPESLGMHLWAHDQFGSRIPPGLMNDHYKDLEDVADSDGGSIGYRALIPWWQMLAHDQHQPWMMPEEEEGIYGGSMMQSPPVADLARWMADQPVVQSACENMYADTQDYLRTAGIDQLQLYRGVDMTPYHLRESGLGKLPKKQPTKRKVKMNPLSSFSLDLGEASNFAGRQGHGAYLTAVVPRERIFATTVTGPGCLGELEALVIGGKTADLMEVRSPESVPDVNIDEPPPPESVLKKARKALDREAAGEWVNVSYEVAKGMTYLTTHGYKPTPKKAPLSEKVGKGEGSLFYVDMHGNKVFHHAKTKQQVADALGMTKLPAAVPAAIRKQMEKHGYHFAYFKGFFYPDNISTKAVAGYKHAYALAHDTPPEPVAGLPLKPMPLQPMPPGQPIFVSMSSAASPVVELLSVANHLELQGWTVDEHGGTNAPPLAVATAADTVAQATASYFDAVNPEDGADASRLLMKMGHDPNGGFPSDAQMKDVWNTIADYRNAGVAVPGPYDVDAYGDPIIPDAEGHPTPVRYDYPADSLVLPMAVLDILREEGQFEVTEQGTDTGYVEGATLGDVAYAMLRANELAADLADTAVVPVDEMVKKLAPLFEKKPAKGGYAVPKKTVTK